MRAGLRNEKWRAKLVRDFKKLDPEYQLRAVVKVPSDMRRAFEAIMAKPSDKDTRSWPHDSSCDSSERVKKTKKARKFAKAMPKNKKKKGRGARPAIRAATP